MADDWQDAAESRRDAQRPKRERPARACYWVTNSASRPAVLNVRTSVRFKPFNDNGSFPTFPDLRFAWRAKLTMNANGEVTVLEPFPEDSDSFKCFGPGY
jgi:hypothetical protein